VGPVACSESHITLRWIRWKGQRPKSRGPILAAASGWTQASRAHRTGPRHGARRSPVCARSCSWGRAAPALRWPRPCSSRLSVWARERYQSQKSRVSLDRCCSFEPSVNLRTLTTYIAVLNLLPSQLAITELGRNVFSTLIGSMRWWEHRYKTEIRIKEEHVLTTPTHSKKGTSKYK
jgi:hypothetical protein